MGIQSLGVGSGLALDDLVTQLVQAERGPKEERLKEREETLDASISAIGSLKSKADEFQDAVEKLKSDYNLNSREPKIDHPQTLEEGEDGPFTVDASSSAAEGDYDIAITKLAEGTKYRTADNTFTATTDSVSDATGTVTFSFSTSTDSFSVNITNGMTLQEYVNAINSNENNLTSDKKSPLVTATLLDTGTAQGPKVIFQSNITGASDELRIINNNDISGLTALTSETSGGANNALNTNTGDDAKVLSSNATATINGVAVQSSSNKFENVIPNVSFEAKEVSELESDNVTFKTSKVSIGNDTQGTDTKIRDFMDSYNSLIDEINRLTKYGESELEDDGALAGDFMIRGLQSGLANLLTSEVSGNTLGSLFQIGLSFDDDGKLEITAADEFGFGSGEDRLKDALADNFDDVADLFTNSTDGIGKRIYDYIYEYTTFGGLLRSREDSLKDEKDTLATERERFELQMLNFESLQRSKYVSLDQTVASLNQTGQALLASLGQ